MVTKRPLIVKRADGQVVKELQEISYITEGAQSSKRETEVPVTKRLITSIPYGNVVASVFSLCHQSGIRVDGIAAGAPEFKFYLPGANESWECVAVDVTDQRTELRSQQYSTLVPTRFIRVKALMFIRTSSSRILCVNVSQRINRLFTARPLWLPIITCSLFNIGIHAAI